jgi:hypothetical protein
MKDYESSVEFSQLYHVRSFFQGFLRRYFMCEQFHALMPEKAEGWLRQQPEHSAPDAGPLRGRKTFDQCPTYPTYSFPSR